MRTGKSKQSTVPSIAHQTKSFRLLTTNFLVVNVHTCRHPQKKNQGHSTYRKETASIEAGSCFSVVGVSKKSRDSKFLPLSAYSLLFGGLDETETEEGPLVPARCSRLVIGILWDDWGIVLISLILHVIVRGLVVQLLQYPRGLICHVCHTVVAGPRNVGIIRDVIQNVDYLAVTQVFTSKYPVSTKNTKISFLPIMNQTTIRQYTNAPCLIDID